jgi:sulfite oxidase
LTLQEFPYCAETNKEFLADYFLTPNDEMYVRNHNLVPQFDEDFEQEYRLEFGVSDELKKIDPRFANKQLEMYSLDFIKQKMFHHQVVTSIACAGNRRTHTRKVYPNVKGLNWDIGAIGNAKYKGVYIRDLLLRSGFSEEELNSDMFKGKHLVATGMDADF